MGMGRLAVMDPNTLGDLEIFLSWRLQGGFMKLGTGQFDATEIILS